MQTKPKTNSIITHREEHDGRLTFVVKDAGDFTFNPRLASVQNRAQAERHGWIQRISDGGALGRNAETGQPASPADKMARMQRLAEHYESGAEAWAIKATASREGQNAGLVIQALMRVLACDLAGVEARLTKLADKRGIDRATLVKELAEKPDVVAAIGEIRAERAAQNTRVNAADMLADLMDESDDGDSADEAEGDDNEAPV